MTNKKNEKFCLVDFLYLFRTVNSVSCSPLDLNFTDEKTLQKNMKSNYVDRSVKKKRACTECDYSCDWKCYYQLHLVTHSTK